ncbi:MAG: prolyl oligopeptidase family serine peptidase, partial [Candidatus Binatia bacterium]
VEDPYRWLESDDEEVRAWSDGQSSYARGILESLPDVDALRAEVRAIIAAPVIRFGGYHPAGGKVFAIRKDPAKEQGELVVFDSPEEAAAARLVLDPTAEGDKTRTIDWFVPSPDGTKVAVSLSVGGSEDGTLHLLDLGGKAIDAPIPGVQYGTGGGDVAWTPDGKGLFYTRYPREGEKPGSERAFWMQVWFHQLGQAEDRYELGKGLSRIAEIMLETDRKGRVLASIQEGDGGKFQHYLRDPKRRTWKQLTDLGDGIVFVGFGPGDDLWMVSRAGAPRGKVLRLPAKGTLAKAKLVIPEGKDAIITDYYGEHGMVATQDRLYINYQLGGPSEVRAFTHTGKTAKAPALPPVSSADTPIDLGDGSLLVGATSYVIPPTTYRFTPKTGMLEPMAVLSPPPAVSLDGFEVHREMATSKDGTKVPVNIVWPANQAKDGSTPCLVNGYGGYGISMSPGFLQGMHPLMSRGVCFVQVNLRGGSEFGEDWHRAGMLTEKQNVFDDFAAALDLVVEGGWSKPERIGIIGGSNGGLLMAALVTQHPGKVKAVVSAVGIYDMLRVETTPNGAYNVPEFGTVKDAAQFAA